MSRTIEIISRHTGKVSFKCKGESRSVVFEEKGSVGVAMVDSDEAEEFLKIGKPDFWKETAIEVKTLAPQDTEKRTHHQVIADIKAAETVEAVEALIVGDERPSVLSAADIRKEELSTPA